MRRYGKMRKNGGVDAKIRGRYGKTNCKWRFIAGHKNYKWLLFQLATFDCQRASLT
jgi:hypothetical protein